MSQPASDVANLGDPVELLLRRIAWRALRGPLVTGAALAAACTGSDPHRDLEQTGAPVFGAESEGGGGAVTDAGGALRDGSSVLPREQRDGAVADSAVARGDPDDFDPCQSGESFPVRAAALKPAAAYDYVAIRQANNIRSGTDDAQPAGDEWGSRAFELLSEAGQACSGATNDGCAQKVALHPLASVDSYCVQGCVEWSVVTTRGDAVERWAEPQEIVQLLGPIDSIDDALMVVASRSYNISCTQAGARFDEPNEAWRRSVRAVAGGYEVLATRYAETCPVLPRRYRLLVTSAGDVQELEAKDFPLPMNMAACIGRLPEGLKIPRAQPNQHDFAAYLARCAHLEAASVHAFERLAAELAAHRAPASLIARARSAAADEVRHAQVVTALSRVHGAEPEQPEVAALVTRSLEAMATENAVEGCVRETYGALVGMHQAERAAEPTLRREMHAIAGDELRHAALSHDVHAWLLGQLDDAARARVRKAQRKAVAALAAECACEPDPLLATRAGLPSAATASSMLADLEHGLWDASAEA